MTASTTSSRHSATTASSRPLSAEGAGLVGEPHEERVTVRVGVHRDLYDEASLQARMTRTAISPRLAIRTFVSTGLMVESRKLSLSSGGEWPDNGVPEELDVRIQFVATTLEIVLRTFDGRCSELERVRHGRASF